MPTTLDQLRPGSAALIEAIRGTDAISQRLMEMGLLEGDRLEVVGLAPFGDPMEIRVGSSLLSLRLSEAARIQVQPLAQG